jgi:hypothetical protein
MDGISDNRFCRKISLYYGWILWIIMQTFYRHQKWPSKEALKWSDLEATQSPRLGSQPAGKQLQSWSCRLPSSKDICLLLSIGTSLSISINNSAFTASKLSPTLITFGTHTKYWSQDHQSSKVILSSSGLLWIIEPNNLTTPATIPLTLLNSSDTVFKSFERELKVTVLLAY